MGFIPHLPILRLATPPSLNAAEQVVAAKYHDYAMRHENGGYDDPIVYAHPPTSEEELLLFTAPFSWLLALLSGEAASLRDKAHCVAAGCLISQRGHVLLSQRSHRMMMRPGMWSWSAAGGIDIDEWNQPWKTAEREACEEVGLQQDHVTGRRVLGCGTTQYRGFHEHWLLTQFFVKNFVPQIEPKEVADTRWVVNVDEVSPLSEDVRAWWPQIQEMIKER